MLPGKDESLVKVDRFSIAQKEPEILEKVLALMKCNAKIFRIKQSKSDGYIHRFSVANNDVYKDLLGLGLKPNKSRTIEFPRIPSDCVRHFIRRRVVFPEAIDQTFKELCLEISKRYEIPL